MTGSPTLVAEIGCNHGGYLDTALRQAELAVESGADVVKFQKRHIPDEDDPLLDRPYDGPHSYGRTYREHRLQLELTLQEHRILRDHVRRLGARYASSVWDIPSLDGITSLDPAYVKIPSAVNSDGQLLVAARDEWAGAVHVSLGMTTAAEEQAIIDTFAESPGRLRLYACTSAYPTPPEDLVLMEIVRLRHRPPELHAVGFSGHHEGLEPDLAAFALGATLIERHFTDDRGRPGRDQALSLTPPEFGALRRALDRLAPALEYRHSEILPSERPTRARLKHVPSH